MFFLSCPRLWCSNDLPAFGFCPLFSSSLLIFLVEGIYNQSVICCDPIFSAWLTWGEFLYHSPKLQRFLQINLLLMNFLSCLGWLRWKIEYGVLKSDPDTPRFLNLWNFPMTVSVLISERHFGVVENMNFGVGREFTSCDLRPGGFISLNLLSPLMKWKSQCLLLGLLWD